MKAKLPLDQCIGITETADASLHIKEWEENLKQVAGGILITKCPSDEFIQAVLSNKDKVIVHFTVTGYAGTILEPNTPKADDVLKKVYDLIALGFNPAQIVIRIDPIIPTMKGLGVAGSIFKKLRILNDTLIINGFDQISRVRYSLIDMYKHVVERFKENDLQNPYCGDTFSPNKEQRFLIKQYMSKKSMEYLIESCAENDCFIIPCVSNRDLEVLGLVDKITLEGNATQRKSCLCPANKVQLISYETDRCPLKCLYCYWK